MSDDEDFEDAMEELPTTMEEDEEEQRRRAKKKSSKRTISINEDELLGESLVEARRAIDLFLNNHFDEARAIVKLKADRSIYHALGYGVFMYLRAVMTFEQKHIKEALSILSDAVDVIDGFRQKNNLIDNLVLKKRDPNSYTEVEIHAELCYAEVLLFKAVLTVCEDENLVSFVKAGFKIRSCITSFRECVSILHERDWNGSKYKSDFESGVRTGMGAFNVLVSVLPSRLLKFLEFIGFSGNREAGFRDLYSVYQDRTSLCHFLSCIFFLGYHLFLSYYYGTIPTSSDHSFCQEIIREKLERYPQGVFFTFFQARLHFIEGQLDDAVIWYQKSIDSQDEWPQFHHICYWELCWAYSYRRNWKMASKFADKLFAESRWSKCFYGYQKAAILCMMDRDELSSDQLKDIVEIMTKVPGWKQKLGGKSLPMEKFAISKSERFLSQGQNRLTLPVIEMIYLWNGFKIIGKHWHLIEPIYVTIERKLEEIERNKGSNPFYEEDLCLATFLKGICLKYMKSPLRAEECFESVRLRSSKLRNSPDSSYLIPYSMAELGFLMKESGQDKRALSLFESAKNDFKGYQLQSRLHFRIHAAEVEIKQ